MRFLVAIVVLASSPALAQVTYTAQTRSIHVFASGLGYSGPDITRSAPDFAPFNEIASSVSSDCWASASQSSSLDPGRVIVETAAGATRHGGFSGIASSALDVTFGVSGSTPWTLRGAYHQISTVILTTQAGTTIFRTPIGSVGGTLDASGLLDPGFYRLQVTSWAEPNVSTSSVALTLTIPGPGPMGFLPLLALAARRSRRI